MGLIMSKVCNFISNPNEDSNTFNYNDGDIVDNDCYGDYVDCHDCEDNDHYDNVWSDAEDHHILAEKGLLTKMTVVCANLLRYCYTDEGLKHETP